MPLQWMCLGIRTVHGWACSQHAKLIALLNAAARLVAAETLCGSLLISCMSARRYAWFAPHIGKFDWIGPTASLLEPDANPPRLTALGRIYVSSSADEYMHSAEVEAELAGAPAQLSAEDRAAITETLPEISKSGSWIRECASCLDASLELLAGPHLAHCRECGLIDNAPALKENLL